LLQASGHPGGSLVVVSKRIISFPKNYPGQRHG